MYIIISHFSRLAYETFELPFYRDWGGKHYGIMDRRLVNFYYIRKDEKKI